MKNKQVKRPSSEAFGVAPDANYRTVRRRYKTLVREYPPEQHPKEFSAFNSVYQEIIGTRETNFSEFPIYLTPLNMAEKKIADQKNESDETILLDFLSVVPESIFNVEFELEKVIKAK